MKLLSFEHKQGSLAAGAKLKETDFSITEDYSHKIRLERKQLHDFTWKAGGDFKVCFNKLSMNNPTFIVHYATNAVTASTEKPPPKGKPPGRMPNSGNNLISGTVNAVA